MSPTPPDYHTARTIGTGQSNPADVRRPCRALTRLGYGRFGNPRGKVDLEEYVKGFDAELRKTIEQFCAETRK